MGGQEVASGVAGMEAGFEPGRQGERRKKWMASGQTWVGLAGERGSASHLFSGCLRGPVEARTISWLLISRPPSQNEAFGEGLVKG